MLRQINKGRFVRIH